MSGYTQAQLDELKSNYAKGVAEIGRGDERIKFRSLSEMEQLITKIEGSLNASAPNRQHYPRYSRDT